MGDKSDYLKYMTERVVSKLEQPAETEEERQERKASKEPWLTKWFGVAPLGIRMWWTSVAEKNETRQEARSAESTPYR